MGALIDSQPGITAETREGTPLSQVIRQRLRKAGVSFRANDNIAAHLREGEADGLQQEVALHIENALRALVIDVDNDHTRMKPRSAWRKCLSKKCFRDVMSHLRRLQSSRMSGI